jgi:EAL domain-containing protein (putative c-di-GMP-specific phosphodiesterase class I)
VRVAVERGRVALLAQPIVAARGGDGDRLHYEVLARLLDDDGRAIAPARFLPALSRLRMLEEFDRVVVGAALAQIARDAALRDRTATVSINLTGPSMADPRMPAFLFDALRRHRIDPSTVVIEITESESMARMETAMANARLLAQGGLSIALDDFGTGLATFDYLRRFSPRWVKIDGSFVRAVRDGPLGRQIVDSIVRVARAAGAQTVAECIEDEALARTLTELGVDRLQGYGIARPMPLAEIVHFRWPAGLGSAHPGPADGAPAARTGHVVATDAA